MQADAAGYVLAGGQSSRMGTDKALVRFRGRPLVQHAVQILNTAGLTATIAGSRRPLAEYAPSIADKWADGERSAGPLAGVASALSSTNAEWNVFLTVDAPLLPACLVSFLLERAIVADSPVTVAMVNGRMEPFPVVLKRAGLATIEEALAAGRRTCRLAWEAVANAQRVSILSFQVENLIQAGELKHPATIPAGFWFQSANTPQDLAFLERVSRERAEFGSLRA